MSGPVAVSTPATPTLERAVSSYPARRGYKPGVYSPPDVPGVAGAIDIHCHAHEGQADGLAIAKLASQSGMHGLLYKTIGPMSGEYRPAAQVDDLRRQLHAWSDAAGVRPVECWAGYLIGQDMGPPSVEKVRENLAAGVVAVWLPVFNHAHSYHRVGARRIWLDRSANPAEHTAPMPWEEALRYGHYALDAHGKLKAEYEEIIRVVADAGAALFFGHATHPEKYAILDLLQKLDFRRAVIDHPFSPFVNLTVPEMQAFARAGVYLNFTYDELSPLLGVDPKVMYDAVRAIGTDQVTLSTDVGEPLFPHAVEAMRQIRGYMAAFGLGPDEIEQVSRTNPAKILGIRL